MEYESGCFRIDHMCPAKAAFSNPFARNYVCRSQPYRKAGASHSAPRGRIAEAFLNYLTAVKNSGLIPGVPSITTESPVILPSSCTNEAGTAAPSTGSIRSNTS